MMPFALQPENTRRDLKYAYCQIGGDDDVHVLLSLDRMTMNLVKRMMMMDRLPHH